MPKPLPFREDRSDRRMAQSRARALRKNQERRQQAARLREAWKDYAARQDKDSGADT